MTTLQIDINDSAPISASCDDTHLTVELSDGRTVRTPIWWYPRLLKATPAQRAAYRLSRLGVHWEEIDEDLSVAGMLRGAKAPKAVPPQVAAE
jgi:Protein of unknown function (DUF2442)